MAEEPTGQEKTEEPTQRRLEEARRRGEVAKSVEIPAVAVLLAGILTLYWGAEYFLGRFEVIMRHFLGNLDTIPLGQAEAPVLAAGSFWLFAQIALPLALVLLVVAFLANVAQVGFFVADEALTPKLERLGPIAGLGRLFSKQAVANLVKSVAKLVVVGYVAYTAVMKALPHILPLMDQEPIQILAFFADTSFWIFLKSVLIIAVLAAADYLFQRWQFMERMRMTKQEIKEEAKQTEGDPHVRGRIRSIQYAMARRRMMEAVPTADVVITNPTRLAVALRYDNRTMVAPQVVAKGAGVVAARIRELAAANGVPVVEDKPLAQALYRLTQVGDTIPASLFQAVAEILAYVYGLRNKSA
ncbi:MAG: flagellar biosynthesis protein FlhB [Thermodesulfobacteriota bacterium]